MRKPISGTLAVLIVLTIVVTAGVSLPPNGYILAFVYDYQGAPIEGALVFIGKSLENADAEPSKGVTDIPDDKVVETDSTLTDMNGYFELSVPEGNYTISVFVPGFLQASQDVAIKAGQVDMCSDFRLIPEATISGTLYGSDGRTPVNKEVVVLASLPSGEVFSTLSDESGQFKLDQMPAGDYVLQVISSTTACPDIGPLHLESGDVIDGVNFVAFAGTITGKVIQEEGGASVPGATVTGTLLFSTYQQYVGLFEASASTDSDGVYQLSGLVPGTYRIQCSAPGMGTVVQPVEVLDETPSAELDVAMRLPGVLSGRVSVAPDGAPAVGASMSVFDEDNNLVILDGALTDEAGGFRFEGLASGVYTLHVSHDGFAIAFLTDLVVMPNQVTENLEILLQPLTGEITGKVLASDGVSPVVGAVVIASSETTFQSVFTNEDGVFSLPTLPEGTYEVVVFAAGFELVTQGGIRVQQGMTTPEVTLELVEVSHEE